MMTAARLEEIRYCLANRCSSWEGTMLATCADELLAALDAHREAVMVAVEYIKSDDAAAANPKNDALHYERASKRLMVDGNDILAAAIKSAQEHQQ